jgi:capsular exopolysaccharide synthesis family protein
MDLAHYLKAVRKFWYAILIPVLLGAGWGVFTVSQEVPQYRGSVTFFVRTVGEGSTNSQFLGDQFAQRRVNSYVALLSSDRLANMLVERSGLDLDPAQVRRSIGASGDINTVLLTATVTSDSEATAEALTQAISSDFIQLVDQVENAGQQGAVVNLEVVSGPSVGPVPTRPTLTVGIRVLAGLLVGLLAALLLELRDTSVRDEEQLEELGVSPLLARIPNDRQSRHQLLIGDQQLSASRAEAFRQLRTNLQFLDVGRPIEVLVVTSSVAGEGKSTTTANLGLTMVSAGRRVLVIEADLRRPKLADYFGVERAVGLTDVLANRARIEDALQPWGTDGLVILPSGQLPPNPSELLGSDQMANLLNKLRHDFDMVLLDTPPLVPVTDAAVAATRADGTLLVAKYGSVKRQQLSSAARSLDAVGARVVGTVFTMTPPRRGAGYDQYVYEQQAGQRPPQRAPQRDDAVAGGPAWGAPAPEPHTAERAGRRFQRELRQR